MQMNFTVQGKAAFCEREVNGYRVRVEVTAIEDKPLDDRTAQLAYTAVRNLFPWKKTTGDW